MKTKKTKTTLCLLIAGMCLSMLNAATPEPEVPKGRRLRDIAAEKFPEGNVYIGGTTGWKKDSRKNGLLDREFAYITPENDFKQTGINPKPGVWRWEMADAWIQSSLKNQQVIRLHGPIGPQVSKWSKEKGRTPEELKANMTEFLTRLCQRYDKYEHVKWIDVINEVVHRNGKWHGRMWGKNWDLPWVDIGYDDTHPLKIPLYIPMSFEIATKHAPNTDLIINQHGGMEQPAWDKIKALVPYLRAKGYRVDGLGWQAHIDVGWEKVEGNMVALHDLITWSHNHQLDFHVTEMNVWLKGENKDYQAQAKTFSAVLEAILQHRHRGMVTFSTWNLSDAEAFKPKRDLDGHLFDRNFKAKPAYYAIQGVLENPPPVSKPTEKYTGKPKGK